MPARTMFPALLTAGLALAPLSFRISSCSTGDDTGLPAALEHDPIFADGNPLNEPIPSDAPVDPDSSTYVAHLVEVVQGAGFLMTLNEFAAPVYYADETTPRYNVLLDYYGTSSYCGAHALLDVPVPDWAKADPGSDGHMIVVDRAGGCTYDFWGFNNNVGVPEPNAWWASGLDTASDGIYHDTVGAGSASNLAYANGIVWPDEIANGEIPHALAFSYPSTRAGSPVTPAEHSDGISSEPYALPEGARVQLDPALDLNSLNLEPYERVIARALQVYGMFLTDTNGAPIALTGVGGQSASQNPWTGLVPDPQAAKVYLSHIPVDRFRVISLPQPHAGVAGCQDTRCGVYQ